MTLTEADIKALIELAEKEHFPGANNKPVWVHPVFTVDESTGLVMDPTTVKAMAEELLAARACFSAMNDYSSALPLLSEESFAYLINIYDTIRMKNEGK